MRHKTLMAVAALCCLVLLTAAGAGLSDRQNAAPASGRWRLSPLVRAGSEVPDVSGARFQEFDVLLRAETGTIYFWGRWGSRDEDWGLFALKDGKVSLISRVGEAVIPPGLQQPSGKKPDKISFHRSAHDATWKGGVHIKTPIHAGKNYLYLSVEEIYQGMSVPWNSGVYTWDGQHLKKLLGADGAFSGAEIGGVKAQALSGAVLNVSTQGEAVIYLIAGPKGTMSITKPRRVLALCDGSQLKPVLLSGDSLPGLPGVKFSDVEFGHTYYAPWIDKPRASVWVSPEATLAILKVDGAAYKKALFRLTPDKSEKIIAVGDPDPQDAGKSVKEILRIEVADRDTFAVLVNRSSRNDTAWLLYHRGKLRTLFDAAAAEHEPGWNELYFGDFKFIRAEPPQVLFEAITAKSSTSILVDLYSVVTRTRKSIRPDYYVYDGRQATRLTKEADHYYFLPRTLSGDYSGAIIAGVSQTWLAGVSPSIPEAEVRKNITSLFLDFTAEELKLQPPPEFLAEEDRRITLADVAAWRAPGQAVVQLPDGIYLLSRT